MAWNRDPQVFPPAVPVCKRADGSFDDYRVPDDAELSALIAEHCLDALEAPIARVAAKDLPIPSSLAMEKMILPQPDDVVKAVKKTLDY